MLLLLLKDHLVRSASQSRFGQPEPVPPPGRAADRLFDVRAHGPGEGEAQARRALLCILVGAAEVHGEDVLKENRPESE